MLPFGHYLLSPFENVLDYKKVFFNKAFSYQHLFYCNPGPLSFKEIAIELLSQTISNSAVTKTDFSYIFITKTMKTIADFKMMHQSMP